MKKSGEKSVVELTAEYNVVAAAKGLGQIKKFKDRPTALARLASIRGDASQKTATKTASTLHHGGGTGVNAVVEQFGFRKGGEREKLLVVMAERMDSMVSKKVLGKLVYSISGLEWRIEGSPGADGKKTRDELPFEIRKERGEERGEEGMSYGLYRKKVHG